MAARKIKLKDQLGRVVRVPTAKAAPTPTTPPATQPETARPAATVWKLIREIPANIQKLAKLVGTGFATRGPDGEWYQRRVAQGEGIAVTNGDGVDGNPTVALAELTNAGGGVLQKTARDGYGRMAGTSTATTDDLTEGGNLYFTDGRADARAALAVDAHVDEPNPHSQYAADLSVVHKAGAETINGTKSFTSDILLSGAGVAVRNDAATQSYISLRDGVVGVTISSGGGMRFLVSTGEAFRFQAGAAVFSYAGSPASDNSLPWGTSSTRWAQIFAASGTINTSDAREKTLVRPFTVTELAASIELGGGIGVYQWLAMIDQKGDAARQHVGMTVQRAIEIMQLHRLDPFAYGFICYDQWDELPEIRNEWPATPQVVDDFGNLVQEAADAGFEIVQEHRPAGDRYSFRMDELLAFIARGMAHRLDAMEQRLAAAGF